MADPLSQLRQYNIDRRDIKEHNDFIIFGDHGWPKGVHTNYQIYSSADDTNKKEYYTLECLLYFLKNKHVAHHHYVKQAGCEQIPVVHRPDRKDLLAYLEGETQSAAAIDKNAPIPSVRLPASEIYKKTTGSSQSAGGDSQAGRATRERAPSGAHKRPHDPEIEKKCREEFAAKLYEPSTKKLATLIPNENASKSGETAEGSAANRILGPEKLAAMRAKHLAVKRTTIIDADELGKLSSGTTDMGAKEDLLISMDTEKFKLIRSKEKIWRTRSSILQSQSKNFLKSILPMLDLLSRSDDPNRRSTGMMHPMAADLQINPMYQQNPNAPLPGGMGSNAQQPAVQRNTYNRYDQERFVKLDIGVEIDTKKSLMSGVASGLPAINQVPVTKSPSTPVQPRLGPPNAPLSANNGHQHRPPHDQVDQRQRHSSGGAPVSRPLKKAKSTVPIIIIPATTTSLINMYNATTILQDLTFAEGKPGSKPRESEILIQRKKQDGTHAFFKIIDNPIKLDVEDWNRVVAVFVQGPAWQFKGWPWNGSPVEIFSRIKAFHLKWDEQKLDDNVAKWNVHVLELSRSKRHLDKANLMKFWSSLDAFMVKYKTFLKF